ncbi:MAG: hypothetical protein IPK97_16715 [Ahniella sp.]|nr:hypothetical protein [Ahniella sp.]
MLRLIVLRIMAALFIGFGLIGAVIAIDAAMNPQQVQQANDNDPFGTPPSLGWSLAVACACGLLAASGMALWRRKR